MNLEFKNIKFQHDLLDVINRRSTVEHWKNEFNFKLIHIEFNYIRAFNYFDRLDGKDIYEERSDENIGFHFWFSGEVETLSLRLFSLLENLNHILNFKYDLIDYSQSRKITAQNIVQKLSDKNLNLANYLVDISKDSRYQEAQKLRNEMTHSHSPLNITEGVERYEKDGVRGGFLSAGEYTNPSTVMNTLNNFIDILKEILDEVKKYV